MTKFLKIIAITIIIILVTVLSIGVLAPSKTYFTRTLIIKIPLSVVWRHILDVENYPDWQVGTGNVEINKGKVLAVNKTLRFYLTDYDSLVFHEETITALENDRLITFLRRGINENPLLNEFQTSYTLKRLLDGTTEVSVSVSYYTSSLMAKIYNQLLLRMTLGNRYEENLVQLRNLCEDI